jgi:hypothetical protein
MLETERKKIMQRLETGGKVMQRLETR